MHATRRKAGGREGVWGEVTFSCRKLWSRGGMAAIHCRNAGSGLMASVRSCGRPQLRRGM
jgi:hypothetical protein